MTEKIAKNATDGGMSLIIAVIAMGVVKVVTTVRFVRFAKEVGK